MSFDFLDKNFFKNNWDEFVHQKIFEQVTTLNSQGASTANSLASQAESHALSAGNLASQAESHALSAGNLASQAASQALSAAVVASDANSTALSANSAVSAAYSLASQADSHALSVVSTASLANSSASLAVSMASQATSLTNDNTNQINKQTQQILNNANNIKELSSNADITHSLASQANSNVAALSQATNGWQTSANSLMHANSVAASQADSHALSAGDLASQAASQALSAGIVANNAQASAAANSSALTTNINNLNNNITANSEALNGLSQATDGWQTSANPVIHANSAAASQAASQASAAQNELDFLTNGQIPNVANNDLNLLTKPGSYIFNGWVSYQNEPANLDNGFWGLLIVMPFRYSQVMQIIINGDNFNMWERYQDPNTKKWSPWINNCIKDINISDTNLMNGAAGTIKAQKLGNTVTINLIVKNYPKTGTVVYQLPSQYRPTSQRVVQSWEINSTNLYIDNLTINADGTITIAQRDINNSPVQNINMNGTFTYFI